MAHMLINPTASVSPRLLHNTSTTDEEKNADPEKAREERKATGRSIAIIIFLSVMCLAIHQVIQRKTSVLAGVLVPCLILFSYTFFVIHISKKDKKKRKQLESSANNIELSTPSSTIKSGENSNKKIPNVSSTSSLAPSTSGNIHQSSSAAKLQNFKNISSKSESLRAGAALKMPSDLKSPPTSSDGRKKVLKKAHSQAHFQGKAIQAAQFAVENERRKVKKSRSFDRHTPLEIHRHTSGGGDNKKVKTKNSNVANRSKGEEGK